MALFGRGRTVGSPRCPRGRHRLATDRLVLCHPTVSDLWAAIAAGSDEQAQRWLGWRPENLIAEDRRDALLALRPGGGMWWATDPWQLIVLDRASDRIAGLAAVSEEHEVGGWLAPQFRGQGLGRELFVGIEVFAHNHLGMATVRAGTEPTNTACVNAMMSAGFVTTTGRLEHRLPDGRTVPAQWFRHDTEHPTTCR